MESNLFRRTFASCHFAKFQNANHPVVEMGNSPKMVYEHHQEVATAEMAKLLWNINPKTAKSVAKGRLSASEISRIESSLRTLGRQIRTPFRVGPLHRQINHDSLCATATLIYVASKNIGNIPPGSRIRNQPWLTLPPSNTSPNPLLPAPVRLR